MGSKAKGMVMAALAAIFWGAMGVAGQYLLQDCNFTPLDLISIRMLLAGSLFVGLEIYLKRSQAFSPFCEGKTILELLVYTLTIIGTQLTYFWCIQESNAPFAAVLTATVPLWIMGIMVVFQHKPLTPKEVVCGLVAVCGVFLVVSGGSLKSFNVSPLALLLGLGSGLTSALYVILPQKLVQKVGSGLATAWALLLTGVFVSVFNHFWNEPLQWTLNAVLAYGFIVIFGTIAAFWLFQAAAELIPADTAGMMETLDPVAATALGMIFLGVSVNFWEIVGGVLILSTVLVLAFPVKHHHAFSSKKNVSS